MHEAETVVQCAKCNGFFTPLGGKVDPPSLVEATEYEPAEDIAAMDGIELKISENAILSEPLGSPLLQKALGFLDEEETIWAMVPGRALDKISEIHTSGRSSSFGIGISPVSGLGLGLASGGMSARSKVKQSMEAQGGILTHYLIVTDRQLVFWMRGILSEWLGAGPEANYIEISSLRGIERRQQRGLTIITFHLEFGDRYFAAPSQWAEKLLIVLRKLIRK